MSIGQRVSFLIVGKTAYGTIVSVEMAGGYLVAIDAQYVSAAVGVLRFAVFFPAVSLTAVGS